MTTKLRLGPPRNVYQLCEQLTSFVKYQKRLPKGQREMVNDRLREVLTVKDLAAICDTKGFKLILPELSPAPMLLTCPMCGRRHIDRGEFAEIKIHKVHACQHCGTLWQPALFPTVGVQFLPGCHDGGAA